MTTDSHLARALAARTAADQAIRHGAIFGPAAFDRHNQASATIARIRLGPARAIRAATAHVAGAHTTPTIGTCPLCLDAYVTARPTPGS
jgi:hypothetical protein